MIDQLKGVTQVLLIIIISFCWAMVTSLANEKPNIVMIVSDDVNKAYHGCYAGRTPTPHLDSLAREGALFENAFAVTPMCNPSRHSFLTGQFPGRNAHVLEGTPEDEPYAIEQNTEMTPGAITIGRLFAEAGYFTGYVGKWHNNFEYQQAGLQAPGFGALEKLGHDPAAPAYARHLEKKQKVDQEFIKACTGFEYAAAILMGNYPNGKPDELNHHNVDWQARGAADFLDLAKNEDRPFFLYVAHSVPHGPDCAKSHDKDPRVSLGGLIDPLEDMPSRESVQERLVQRGINPGGAIYGVNYGMVRLDDQVGTVLQRLEEMGVEDNTIVLYFSDHGIFGKFTAYYPGIDMPVIMKWPARIEAGTRVKASVSYVDFLPTLLDAAEVDAPDDYKLDGISFLPALMGEDLERKAVFSESGYTRSVVKGDYQYLAFRLPQRLVEKAKNGEIAEAYDHFGRSAEKQWAGDLNIHWKPHYFDPDQLYHIRIDPFCRNNLADDPAYAEILADMKAEMKAYTESFERPFPLDEVDPFLLSMDYANLIQARFERVAEKEFYPPNSHAELVYNLNLPDPETD